MTFNRTYIGASLIAVAGILFWVLAMPLYNSMTSQKETLAERNKIVQEHTEILKNIKDLSDQYSKKTTDIEKFSSIIPAQKSVPELISALQALASQNGLQLAAMSLVSNADEQEDNSYNAQSLNIELSGSYLSFKSFLLALEKNIRIIDITSINGSPSTENESIINFKIQGDAYYLK